MAEIQNEISKIEADDDDLLANEDCIALDNMAEFQITYKADSKYLHPKVSVPSFKLLFKQDFLGFQKLYQNQQKCDPKLWDSIASEMIQLTYEEPVCEHTRQLALVIYREVFW